VTQDIEEGAHVSLSVKLALNYGGQIPILTRDVDLCQLMASDEDIDTKCPVNKEKTIELSKTVGIPQTPSKGKYVIQVDAYTKDEQKITCMGAEIIL
jgi:ML domain